MKKGLVLLFAFILTIAFSAEVFAGEVKTNFGVKKREKEVAEQRLSQERVKESSAKKIPLVQPLAEMTVAATTTVVGAAATITDAMYSTVVDNIIGKIGQMKDKQSSGETKAALKEPQKAKQTAYETSPQEVRKITKASEKKERVKREVEPKNRSTKIK